MKVRLTENRIALRLSEGDILALESRQVITVGVSLGPNKELRFELGTDTRLEVVRVSMDGSTMRFLLPESWVKDWRKDDRIGFDSIVRGEDGAELHVKVEKDLRWFKNKSAAG